MTDVSSIMSVFLYMDRIASNIQAFIAPHPRMLKLPPTAPRVFKAVGIPRIPVVTVYL